jgi:hypothetical protein
VFFGGGLVSLVGFGVGELEIVLGRKFRRGIFDDTLHHHSRNDCYFLIQTITSFLV